MTATALGTLWACAELTSVDPSYQNLVALDTVYAVNGGPPMANTAIDLFDGALLHADQGFGYDLAFDIDSMGRPVIIPARALASAFVSPYSVSLRTVTLPFELVLEAPEDGYRADTAATIGVGQVVVIQSHDADNVCYSAVKGSSFFSKLVVSEVDLEKRRLVFTVMVNRNCGFRSFETGYPRF